MDSKSSGEDPMDLNRFVQVFALNEDDVTKRGGSLLYIVVVKEGQLFNYRQSAEEFRFDFDC